MGLRLSNKARAKQSRAGLQACTCNPGPALAVLRSSAYFFFFGATTMII
jgi:hypothetical protein